ncbi:hypothetical protein EPO44_02260, partial [bacterium]
MKILGKMLLAMAILLPSAPLSAQYTKPVYISLPSAGNVQHLALATAKFKGFYDEMGVPNAQKDNLGVR